MGDNTIKPPSLTAGELARALLASESRLAYAREQVAAAEKEVGDARVKFVESFRSLGRDRMVFTTSGSAALLVTTIHDEVNIEVVPCDSELI